MEKAVKCGNSLPLSKVFLIIGELLLVLVIFCVGFKFEYQDRNLFSLFKSSPAQSEMMFDDVSAINIYAHNIDLAILESDTDKILIKNSIETNGVGVFTEPKIWTSDNTLFYDQGLIISADTWEIIEDNFDLEIHTSGSLIIEVPMNMTLDFVIKNPEGHTNLDIAEANNVTINSSPSDIDFKTKCETLKITTDNQNVNIYEPISNITAFTKSGDVSIYANDKTNSIDFETKSGRLNVFADELGGYNHNNQYISLSNNYSHTIDVIAKEVNIYDKNTINELGLFFKEDN